MKINWKYALGEIAIVIIGITIAFSLNRWAEYSRNEEKRAQYLTNLIADLDHETEHLQMNIDSLEAKKQTARFALTYLYGRKDGRAAVAPQIFSLAQDIPYFPNNNTYTILLNSGDLELFDNFEFRAQLEAYYSQQTRIEIDYERQGKINERFFADFLIYRLDYTKLRKADYSYLDDPMLRNIVQSLYGTYDIAIRSSQDGIERSQKLKAYLQTL